MDSLVEVSTSALGRTITLAVGLAIVSAVIWYGLRWLSQLTYRRLGRVDPDLARRLAMLRRMIRTALVALAVVVIVDAILGVVLADYPWPWVDAARGAAIRTVTIVIIALLAYWLTLLVSIVLPPLASDEDETTRTELEQRAQTVSVMARRTGVTVIAVVAVMMILPQLGIDVGPVLAGAGIVGLAVGFGAQTLVRDVLSGFFIILDNRVAVGDDVTISGVRGTVEKIALRTIELRDLDGTLHIIPNGDIRAVSNRNKIWTRRILKVRIGYDADEDAVEALLGELTSAIGEEEEYADILLAQPVVLPFTELNEAWVSAAIVLRTKADQHWEIARDLRRRILSEAKARDLDVRLVGADLVDDTT